MRWPRRWWRHAATSAAKPRSPSVDLPFLALVVWAAVAAARRGPASAWPYALLAAAGLMRPEAWGLVAALWVWAAISGERRSLLRLGGLALLAPVLWMLSDLVVTGDLLWSLHGTRELAAALERPRGAGDRGRDAR